MQSNLSDVNDVAEIEARQSDMELVQEFLAEVVGIEGTKVAVMVPGVTADDVSRWRNGKAKRIGEPKRAAIKQFFARLQKVQQADKTADAAAKMEGPTPSDAEFWAGVRAIETSDLPPLLKTVRVESLAAALRQLAVARDAEAAVIRARLMEADVHWAGKRHEAIEAGGETARETAGRQAALTAKSQKQPPHRKKAV